MLKKKSILLLILFVSYICGSAKARIIYVDASKSSCGDGLSWTTAYKYLQDALGDASASPDCNIYVAEGTYNPDQNCVEPNGTGDRTATFQLINNVAIYGGFPTDGCNWDDRDWKLNETILSGDLLGNDVEVADPCDLLNDPCRAENSYHVVTGSGTDANAALDGFTITAGNANDPNYATEGGGMYNSNACPTVKNCTFKENSARGYIYCCPHFVGGGGMYNYGTYGYDEDSPTISNCVFSRNSGGDGGGMFNDGSSPQLTNCMFTRNTANAYCDDHGNCRPGYGGGIYNAYDSEPTLENCVFTDNSAEDGGGMYNDSGNPTLTNCTFTGNSAQGNGGGIDGDGTLTNCILWDNNDVQIDGDVVVTYSDVQGGWPGRGNIKEDPCFLPNDYHLDPCSACIEAGDPYYVAGPDETDIDGEPRIMYGSKHFKVAIDMGADEFYLSDYFVLDDFEDYDDRDDINDVWQDGDGNGDSYVTISTDPGVPYQRHTGEKAMAFFYDNSSDPCYSEVFAYTTGPDSLDFGSDWASEVNTLSLWFHGIEDLRGSHDGSGTDADPYVLEGDGSGILNTTSDSFYFFYKRVDNIFPLVEAKVEDIEDTDDGAMAGVMLRDTNDCDSVYAATVVTADGRVIFIKRTPAGTNSSESGTTVTGVTLPHWVRIKRHLPQFGPTTVYAEHSENGTDWEAVGQIPNMAIGSKPTNIGLCVTSNSYGDMCTAEFSNIRMAEDVDYTDPDGTDVGDPDSDVDICIDYIDNDPQPMYVGLEDSDSNAIWYYPDSNNPADANANVVLIGGWNQWLIDMNVAFHDQGVDLSDVNSMYIGFGNRSEPNQDGSGLVYFDDIYLFEQSIIPCELPLPPSSIDYPDSNCTGDYTVEWGSSSGATYYELDVNDGSGWDPCYYGGSNTYCEFEDVEPNTYRYRVRACNDCGCSEPCEGGDCIVSRTPEAPASIDYPSINCSGDYTVSWASSDWATYYELDVNDGSGWDPCYYGGSNTYCEFESVEPNTYIYRVRACNYICGCGGYREGGDCIVSRTPAAPASIDYPSSNCSGDYTVSWASSDWATYYELDVNDGSGWDPCYYGGSNTYCEFESVEPNTYRYRVRACNETCDCGDPCEGGDCIVSRKPAAPADINYPTSNCYGNYDVNWAPSDWATYYELERSSDRGTTWTEPIYTGADPCCRESGLDCNSYLYRVRACNTICGCSDPCDCIGDHNCVVTKSEPDKPISISYPDHDCGNGSYEVSWTPPSSYMEPCKRVTYYEVDVNVYDGNDWSGWVQDYNGPDPCYIEDVDVNNCYRYRVRACNACGDSNDLSGKFNCEVATTPEAPNDITYPDSDDDGIYTVCWAESVGGATYYQLQSSCSGGDTWVLEYEGPNTCYSYDVNDLDRPGGGTWIYRVRAVNTGVCSDEGVCFSEPWIQGDNCVVTDCLAACQPNCVSCYDEWSTVRYPYCWCGSGRQCHGDAADDLTGTPVTGYTYVGPTDLVIFASAWKVLEPPKGLGIATVQNGICADFAHDKTGTPMTGYTRVGPSDLTIFATYWKILEPPHGPGIDPNCLDCP